MLRLAGKKIRILCGSKQLNEGSRVAGHFFSVLRHLLFFMKTTIVLNLSLNINQPSTTAVAVAFCPGSS